MKSEVDLAHVDLEQTNLVLIVVGAHLRAEVGDRPLATRLQNKIGQWTRRHAHRLDTPVVAIVCTDLWYLNNEELHGLPTICLGGPGVNALSAYFAQALRDAEAESTIELIQDAFDASDDPDVEAVLSEEEAYDLLEQAFDPDDPEAAAQVILQIDPEFTDLRVCLWGTDHDLTARGLKVFTRRYLNDFLKAVATQVEPETA